MIIFSFHNRPPCVDGFTKKGNSQACPDNSNMLGPILKYLRGVMNERTEKWELLLNKNIAIYIYAT